MCLGYLKHQIWSQDVAQQPTNMRQFKGAIVAQCRNLDPVMIRDAFEGMVNRARRCLNANGNTFPNE